MSPAADVLEQRCRDTWPELSLDAEMLVACAEREQTRAEARHQPEVYLSRACLAGHESARSLFENRFLKAIDGSLEELAGDAPDLLENVRDRLRSLLIDEGLLEGYRGRGPLQGWVNRWAVRLGLQYWHARQDSAVRRGTRWVPTLLWPDTGTPWLDELKRRHRGFLTDLLRHAASDLIERDRMIVQLHWVDDLGTTEIAERLAVRTATVTLGLANARRTLSETARRLLWMIGHVSADEQAGLDQLIRTQLELALGRDLQPAN